MKPSIILLLAILTQPAFGQILFSNRVTGETGYVTNVDEYFQDAKVVATNANNKFGGDGSLLTGLPASGPPLNGTNAWSGTNSFAKPVTADNLTSTNGFTNLSLTASTVLVSDANKKVVSLAGGGANTVLHGTTPEAYSSVANADLANSSITVSGGGGVGISGSPVSLGGTVTVGTTTDQRQMASLGLGVAASATSGTFQGTNTLYVGTGTIGSSNVMQVDWTNGMAMGVNKTNGWTTLTTIQSTSQTNSGNIKTATFNTTGNGIIGGTATIGSEVLTGSGSLLTASANFGTPTGSGYLWTSAGGWICQNDGFYFLKSLSSAKAITNHFGDPAVTTAVAGYLKGDSPSSGTDKAGGDVHIVGGVGRGTGTPGNLYFDTSSASNGTGSAAQTISSQAVLLGGNGGMVFSNGMAAVSGTATTQFITNTVYTNVSLDFPSTAAGASSDMLVTIANLKSNDFCIVNPAGSAMANGTVYSGWVSNTTCYVRLNNYNTVVTVDPAAQNYQVKIEQWK